jgi:hypothetical protein
MRVKKQYVTRKEIIDERCYCGHLRSVHADTIAQGHGACTSASGVREHCDCKRFTWASFVFGTGVKLPLDEAIQQLARVLPSDKYDSPLAIAATLATGARILAAGCSFQFSK